MLGGVGLVGRVGQGRFMGTLFPWVTNPSLRAALNEAARTGLVLGMGAPSGEENWLRGVRQGPLASGVTGATYARSGTRTGSDPADLFFQNLARATEAFDDAVWAKIWSGLTPNAGLAPNGAETADLLTADGTNNQHRLDQVPVSPAQVQTFSVFAKAAGYNWVSLRIGGGVAGRSFNLSTGLIGISGSATATITPFPNGWYRCTITVIAAANDTIRINIENADSVGTAFTGDGTSGILLWGAQLVQGDVPAPYVPNPSPTLSASQVRREAGRGVRVFGAGTNEARNSTASGGTVGVIGSGGVLPTRWNATLSGLTCEIVSITGAAVRLRFSGTPSAGFIDVGFASDAWVSAVPGQFWVGSRYARLVAGALPAAALNAFQTTIHRFDAAFAYLGQASISTLFNGSTFVRGVCIAPALAALTAFVDTRFQLFVNNGVPCDFTIEIAAPQLEQSAFATDYIPNASTTLSASAGADDLQIAASNLPASGPIVFIADLPADVVQGTGPRPFVWGIDVFFTSATEVGARAGVAGTAATVTGLASGGARRIAVLYTPGAATRLSVNGSVVNVGTDVGDALPIGFPLYVGNNPALTRPLNRSLGVLAVYLGNPSDAQLQAMSAL